MSLGEIIRNKREQLELTLDEVSGKVEFSKPYLSTIETSKVKNPPSDELLNRLERVLKFEPGILLHIAHMERMPLDVRSDYEAFEAENKKWRQIIKNLMNRSTKLNQLSKVLTKSALSIKQKGPALPASQLVPIINKVTSGYPADFDDLDYPASVARDYLRCPDLHDPNAFAAYVCGDSMEPKFKKGDVVIFSPAAEVHNGDDCFVRFATPQETTFKRIFFEPKRKVRLQPRNDMRAPQIVEKKSINGLYRAIMKYEKL